MYARDISRKTRAAFNAKAKSGQFIASRAPFGCKKSPEDKHKLIVDEPAAEVVRKIFDPAVQGCGYNRIAKALRAENILNPQAYCSSHYIRYDALYQIVLTEIRRQARQAAHCETRFRKRLQEIDDEKSKAQMAKARRQLEASEARASDLERIMTSLYEDKALGRLSQERFDSMMGKYEAEQKALLEQVNALREGIARAEEQRDNTARFVVIRQSGGKRIQSIQISPKLRVGLRVALLQPLEEDIPALSLQAQLQICINIPASVFSCTFPPKLRCLPIMREGTCFWRNKLNFIAIMC